MIRGTLTSTEKQQHICFLSALKPSAQLAGCLPTENTTHYLHWPFTIYSACGEPSSIQCIRLASRLYEMSWSKHTHVIVIVNIPLIYLYICCCFFHPTPNLLVKETPGCSREEKTATPVRGRGRCSLKATLMKRFLPACHSLLSVSR